MFCLTCHSIDCLCRRVRFNNSVNLVIFSSVCIILLSFGSATKLCLAARVKCFSVMTNCCKMSRVGYKFRGMYSVVVVAMERDLTPNFLTAVLLSETVINGITKPCVESA